jgi:hypothetical protein
MAAEKREWCVIRDGAVTVEEKVFRQGELVKITELGDKVDWLFDQNSVRWASAAEIESRRLGEAPKAPDSKPGA